MEVTLYYLIHIVGTMKKELKRANVNITEKEYLFLQKESEDKDISMSELLRRILDDHIEKQLQEK